MKKQDRTKLCPGCQEMFQAKDLRQIYCSHSCAASTNNLGISRYPVRMCQTCGIIPVLSQRKRCQACIALAPSERIAKWKSGEESASELNGTLKRWAKSYLIQSAGFQCKCGWGEINPILGYSILTVDHIDGDWTNNSFENLEVLCFNCHTLTSTFGALNRGKAPKGRPRG